jgi:hypothetical protein
MSKHTVKSQSEWEEAESSRMEAGKSVVPAYALPKWVDNSKEYIERFKTPDSSTYNSELAFFRAWLKSMNDDGIAVMVVCMPTTEMNRKLLADKFWSKFRADINSSCKTFKADCFDLSDCELFKPTDYLDTVHLNVYGGFKLFPVIAERITLRPYYVNALSQKKETK